MSLSDLNRMRMKGKQLRKEAERRHKEAKANPVKVSKVGVNDSGQPIYTLFLYTTDRGLLREYRGSYEELAAIYRKTRNGFGKSAGVSSILPGGVVGMAGAAHHAIRNKQYFRQMQELAGVTPSDD